MNDIEDRKPVVEIVAPNGTIIRFYEPVPVDTIKELIDSFMVQRGLILAGVPGDLKNK
uniref:hypothetical protein n=1 Tax=Pedobacter schmidteae TaxID=2201271 RepID=UPI0013CEA768|nr:hypothetical protein [Pedobacter schmidteae]